MTNKQFFILVLVISLFGLVALYTTRTIPTPEQIKAESDARIAEEEAQAKIEEERTAQYRAYQQSKPPEVRSAEIQAEAMDSNTNKAIGAYVISKLIFK